MDIRIIFLALFIAYFIFQIWYAVRNKLWGKFDRTSQIVWGVVGLVLVGLFVSFQLLIK